MDNDWTVAYTTAEQYRAEMVRQVLETNGLEAVIMDKRDSAYGLFGHIDIMVRKADEIKARSLLKELET